MNPGFRHAPADQALIHILHERAVAAQVEVVIAGGQQRLDEVGVEPAFVLEIAALHFARLRP